MKKLNIAIVKFISNRLGFSEGTVKTNIYNMQKHHSKLTKNALAQLYSQKHGLSVYKMLDVEDRASLPSVELIKEKITVTKKTTLRKKSIQRLFEYQSADPFLMGHIEEFHRAYTYGCYTACFILFRKIIENLIIDILRKKYPPTSKENKELYFDLDQKRFKDFSVILKNLHDKKDDFGPENKLVERIYNLAKSLKDNVNDKTHSLYHLVVKASEIDDLNPSQLIQLIQALEKTAN